MAGDYRVFVCRNATDSTHIAELENARPTQIIEELGTPGAANITMPTQDPKMAALVEGHAYREIQIWRDGELLFWGVPWRMRGDRYNHFIECQGIASYLERRFIEDTLAYGGTEQMLLGWNLIDYTQTNLGSFGITQATYTGSGQLRDRTYLKDEHRNIADILYEWFDTINGFEWAIECYGDGRKEYTPYYPRRGTLRPELVLEYGRNIVDYRYSKEADRMVTRFIMTGAGEGDAKPEVTVSDWALFFDGVNDSVTITDQAWLDFNYNENFSIEFDFHLPSSATGTGSFVDRRVAGSPGAPYAYLIEATAGHLRFSRSDGTHTPTVTSIGTYNDAIKHHAAFVKSGGSLHIIVDDRLDNSTADTTTTTTNNASDIFLGMSPDGTRPLSFKMNELRVWNEARTPFQVSAYKDLLLNPGYEIGMTLYLRMNEGGFAVLNDISVWGNPPAPISGAQWIQASDMVFLTDVGAVSNQGDLNALVEMANGFLSGNLGPILIPEVQVIESPTPLIQTVKAGDTLPVNIKDGATDVYGAFRVIRKQIDPPTDTMWLQFTK